MSDFVKIELTGFKDLQELLEKMPLRIARRLLRNAILDAVNVWKEEIQLRAPKLSQDKQTKSKKSARRAFWLSDHILAKVSVDSDLEAVARVGPAKSAFYAGWLEFGTQKMRAKPFIIPAFEAMKEVVLARFVKAGQKIVAEEAPKKS